MAASGAPERQPRRGPAPIASFDHDVSDESSPETKQTARLPEIREDPSCSSRAPATEALAPPEQRGRSHSTPAASGLRTPPAPRIDISRASSSSHQDSRDSSPELALFAGGGAGDGRARLELGFREDGALELRSSTEELAFLEPAPGEPRPPAAAERRHSRKDSQSSEAALLAVSGRTSRLSSVGSQCSAHSALSAFSHTSRVSRLSVVSGVSRSPSPHKMLLETSFCGPKPIETDPEICAAAVEERLLEMAKLNSAPAPAPTPTPVDARDRREIRTEATVERASSRPPSANRTAPPAAGVGTALASASSPPATVVPADGLPPTPDDDKRHKETKNRARVEERRARPRRRRESRDPEIRQPENRSKDIIRIKLKPDSEYDDEDEDESERTLIGSDAVRKPASLSLGSAARPTELAAGACSPDPPRPRPPRDSRTPSPAGPAVSRKSSFCSLFKSRETIASPDSPSDALRRKKSLTEGRSRSRSRDRSATPTSAAKIRGSVLSLFRTPRKSATSPSPSSRDGSPVVQPQRQIVPPPADRTRRNDRLKYYEESKDGIIHIPLRTPPDELKDGAGPSGSCTAVLASAGNASSQIEDENEVRTVEVVTHREPNRPASAPQPRSAPAPAATARPNTKPISRIVLPDGSIIIPLHSPTEKIVDDFPVTPAPSNDSIQDKSNVPIADAIAQSPVQSVTSPSESFVATEAEPPPEVSHERPRPARVEPTAATKAADERVRRKERIMFSTHVGSRDQVFSTQFSITKTPSVTSEISGSFPCFPDEELRTLRDTHIAAAPPASPAAGSCAATPTAASPPGALRDSSESEPSSEAAPPRCGSDVEQRGLVVQESFEEELPYVPTTLPLERSLALPMVPVRERGGVRVTAVQRPRAAAPPPAPPRAAPAPAAAPPSAAADKLRIRLPRRPRTTSASGPSRSERMRTRSGSEGYEPRPKPEWIDFEEVPERRKQPKRIQTLPAAGAARDVVFSYVEPEHCRCECHAHGEAAAEPAAADSLPLLGEHGRSSPQSPPPAESAALARPFTGDLGLRDQEPARPH